MPELRKDPISGRWVIISIERGKRPSDFGMRVSAKKGGFCAVCEGNDHTTPPEILAVRTLPAGLLELYQINSRPSTLKEN